ncbi:MAG: phosphoglycerate dehydrogenase [Anaerolineales bacterium]
MPTILFSAPYMIPFLDRFGPLFEKLGIDLVVPEVEERLGEEALLSYAGQFDGAICGDDQYSRRVIEACQPRLKVISKWGTGIDSIDQEACADYGILIGNTPNAFTLAVSDSVLGYMLTFARKHPWMDQAMKKGIWKKIPGRSLSECTLGVIGIGNIGRAVIERAKPFRMAIVGNDIREIDPEFIQENSVEMVSLEELLNRADFVSVNCTLNPTSIHLIDAVALSNMKDDSVLINTARGQVVDEKALVDALKREKIAGAALDVFENEPLPAESPLRGFENVLLAPHNSNSSPQAWERVHWNTIRNLLVGLDIPFQTNDRGEIL